MGDVKTIKGVDDETWSSFKTIAAKNRVNMGALFKEMVSGYKSGSKDVWSELLSGKKLISNKEADEMDKVARRLRKEHGFRV
ncbi:MAG: hypothetical protein AABX47_06760 [Nanoarchaeota archaeon]